MSSDQTQLEPNLTSVRNFRPVSKKLYRSANQDSISAEDVKKLEKVGLKTVIDFRSLKDYQRARGDKLLDKNANVFYLKCPEGSVETTDGLPAEIQVIRSSTAQEKVGVRQRYVINFLGNHMLPKMVKRLSVFQWVAMVLYLAVDFVFSSMFSTQYFAKTLVNPAGLAASYIDILELSGRQINASLYILSQPENLPALVNCAIGKDRTGVVSALVLAVLGHSDEYIAEDYARSEEGLKEIRGKVMQEIASKFNYAMDESFASAEKETMLEVLRHLKTKYGSVSKYLETIGFSSSDQDRLRETMTE